MGCERCGCFWIGFWAKIRHQIVGLMSCERVISYICVSLYYVSLQVNKIRSIFQIWVRDEWGMFGLVMWILMSSVRGWFLDDLIAGNAWFLWVKWGWDGYFVLSNLYGFFEDFDWVRLKPYFIRDERILGCYEVIFSDVEMVKNIDFSRFCRTRYRTQNGGRGVDGRDMPVYLANKCSKNVNHAPYWHKNTL